MGLGASEKEEIQNVPLNPVRDIINVDLKYSIFILYPKTNRI